MMNNGITPELASAAQVLAADMMCIKAGESVLISADTSTDMPAVEAVQNACCSIGAKVATIVLAPRLPYQGALADTYLPDHFKAAVRECDVWIDLCFPYLAGSKAFDSAMQNQRTRYFLGADIGAGGLARLLGKGKLDQLFALSNAFGALVGEASGKECRITNRLGTDVTFTLAEPDGFALAKAEEPGGYFVPGTVVLIPELESVRGVIKCETVFHEYYTTMAEPLSLALNGKIQEVTGGGPERRVMERALRRAGGGEFGYVVHFSCGLHPGARFTGKSFIEDQRITGYNAIGLGLPPWMPGGGENHPDAVMSLQSISITDQEIVKDGTIVSPPALVELAEEVNAALS